MGAVRNKEPVKEKSLLDREVEFLLKRLSRVRFNPYQETAGSFGIQLFIGTWKNALISAFGADDKTRVDYQGPGTKNTFGGVVGWRALNIFAWPHFVLLGIGNSIDLLIDSFDKNNKYPKITTAAKFIFTWLIPPIAELDIVARLLKVAATPVELGLGALNNYLVEERKNKIAEAALSAKKESDNHSAAPEHKSTDAMLLTIGITSAKEVVHSVSSENSVNGDTNSSTRGSYLEVESKPSAKVESFNLDESSGPPSPRPGGP